MTAMCIRKCSEILTSYYRHTKLRGIWMLLFAFTKSLVKMRHYGNQSIN